jgi:hypothetical protein
MGDSNDMNKETEREIDELEDKIEKIEENQGSLVKFKKKYPGIIMLIATISVFGTLFTSANLFFGVQFRPAWHWEHMEVREEIINLEISQLDLRRVLFSRDLSRFISLREGYILRSETVPDWLDEEIATIEASIVRIGEEIHTHKEQID